MRTEPALMELLEQVRAALRSQSGRLVGLHVTVPPAIVPADAERALVAGLSGSSPVDVRVEPRTGPARVLSMEFLR
jgi:hypothetical protein